MSSHNLINGIRSKTERECNDLRSYAPPSEVQVYRIVNGVKELIRTDPPTNFIAPSFNGGKRGK